MSASFKAKELVVKTSLLALGLCFEMVSRHSREMQDELGDWEEGRVVSLGVLPEGPSMAVRKEVDILHPLHRGLS